MGWGEQHSLHQTPRKKKVYCNIFSNGLLWSLLPHWVELPCGCLRHTFTTRLVYSVIPSECYAPGGATIDPLLQHLVQDLNQLEQEGLEAKYTKLIYSKPTKSRYVLSRGLWLSLQWLQTSRCAGVMGQPQDQNLLQIFGKQRGLALVESRSQIEDWLQL